MMRYFWHEVFHQISIHLQDELIWRHTLPDGTPTRSRNLHCYARQFPDQGHPECECGLIPVQEAMFQCFLREVEEVFAAQADPQLVAYAQRIASTPSLPQLLTLLPRWAKLHLVACEWTAEGTCFDVYRVVGPDDPLLYLNPHLTALLPWREIDGQPRLLAPGEGTTSEASAWLVQALAVRLWGTDHAPTYAYDLAS